ncbi:uncharacterized protein LOC120159064 [Hibiscus syriacus]|uniref:uncharacterized protein LOC120159064 n=1 Tax=Hibiscus syriacus TaxID=106335 RepID=UPI001921F7B2|nr:uncharacterized protein LOC120159064 [Hibiscus syriacus]
MMDWRKLFSCSAGNQLRYFPPNLRDGTPTVHPPPEVFKEGIAEWRLSLVGHFLGAAPKFSALQQIIDNLWKKPLQGASVQTSYAGAEIPWDFSQEHLPLHISCLPAPSRHAMRTCS